jgi:hypothetical protein
VNTLKIETTSWFDELKSYSSFRAQGEAEGDFDFLLTFDDVSSKFNQSNTPNLIALLIGIGLYLLMFLSYFITRRHSKNHYTLFGKKTESINDGIDIKY